MDSLIGEPPGAVGFLLRGMDIAGCWLSTDAGVFVTGRGLVTWSENDVWDQAEAPVTGYLMGCNGLTPITRRPHFNDDCHGLLLVHPYRAPVLAFRRHEGRWGMAEADARIMRPGTISGPGYVHAPAGFTGWTRIGEVNLPTTFEPME